MDWLFVLERIFEIAIIPLIGILLDILIKAFQAKVKEINKEIQNETAQKYVNWLSTIIVDCVNATNQTYVEKLKEEGAFTKEAQTEALDLTYQSILDILSEEGKEVLKSVYGDLETYIISRIESEIYYNKWR